MTVDVCSASANCRLSCDMVDHMMRSAYAKPFALTKILFARNDYRSFVDEKMLQKSYEELCKKNCAGLFYLKWMRTKELPNLLVLVDAATLGHLSVFKVFDRHFKHFYRRIGYIDRLERCTRMCALLGHTDIVKFLYCEASYNFPDHLVYDTYVHGEKSIVELLYHELHIKPTPDVFLHMMCTNPEINCARYLPAGVPFKVILLTYGLFHGEKRTETLESLEELKCACLPDDLVFTPEECDIYRHFCELEIPEIYNQMEDENDDDEEYARRFPMWKLLRYIQRWFGTYPPTYDMETCFAEIIESRDVQGLMFVFRHLGWIPPDIGLFYDVIFQDRDIARTFIRELNVYDWEEVFEEVFDEPV